LYLYLLYLYLSNHWMNILKIKWNFDSIQWKNKLFIETEQNYEFFFSWLCVNNIKYWITSKKKNFFVGETYFRKFFILINRKHYKEYSLKLGTVNFNGRNFQCLFMIKSFYSIINNTQNRIYHRWNKYFYWLWYKYQIRSFIY
jgi:hypothetical protein